MLDKIENVVRHILHILEIAIALTTLFVIIWVLGLEIYRMVTSDDYFSNVEHFLQSILTLVVGLEFVRMLIDMTPANTLDVLIVAISRHIILSHDEPLSNLACVACIAALFAVRRFLVPKKELDREFSEMS